jgi:hypothetical protein
MRFTRPNRLRLLAVLALLSVVPMDAEANTRFMHERAGQPTHALMRTPGALSNAQRSRNGNATIEVRGRRRMTRFWLTRRTGTISIREGKLFVDGAVTEPQVGKVLRTAGTKLFPGRKFEILDFELERGILVLRRKGKQERIVLDQFGYHQATEQMRLGGEMVGEAQATGDRDLLKRGQRLLANGERNLVLAQANAVRPTLDIQEPDRLVPYSGNRILRLINVTPWVNRVFAASHNPIRFVMGRRTRTGQSAIVRRYLMGGSNPKGIFKRLTRGYFFYRDLGKAYAGTEALGQGTTPGTIEFEFADGTHLIDSPALGEGELPGMRPLLLRWLLGSADNHVRRIEVARRMSAADPNWLKLNIGWIQWHTEIRLTERP